MDADLDGDLDLLAIQEEDDDQFIMYLNQGYGNDGALEFMRSYTFNRPVDDVSSSRVIAIADYDNDGDQELVIMIRRGATRGTLITSVDGDIIHNGGGEETWVEEFFVNSNYYGGGSPYHSLPADLNGDGVYELVNHTWNNLNFYNITSTGADQYDIADIESEGRHYQAAESDQVSLFGGAAVDIDDDGNDEAYFVSYGSWGNGAGDVYVVDYDTEDDVLTVSYTHLTLPTKA